MLSYAALLETVVYEASKAVKTPDLTEKFWIDSLGNVIELRAKEHHYDSMARLLQQWHTVFGKGWVRAGANSVTEELYLAFDPEALTQASRKGLARAIREHRPTTVVVDELEWCNPKSSHVLDAKQFRQKYLSQTPA